MQKQPIRRLSQASCGSGLKSTLTSKSALASTQQIESNCQYPAEIANGSLSPRTLGTSYTLAASDFKPMTGIFTTLLLLLAPALLLCALADAVDAKRKDKPSENPMTRPEAKRWACLVAYGMLQSHVDSDCDFGVDREKQPADHELILECVCELIDEMFRRSGRGE